MRKRGVCAIVLIGGIGLAGITASYFLRGKGYVTRMKELAFYKTSLPTIQLDTSGVTTDSKYEEKYRFRYWSSLQSEVWQKVLADFQGKPDVRYLEIGLFEGRSAFWMMEHILTHPTSRLTGIDVFEDPEILYKDVFFENMKASGFEARMNVIIGPSQIELRKLPIESYDIIYIDGSHRASDVLEDAVLCWRLLKEGGILIFDDYYWRRHLPPSERPKVAIDAFFMFFGSHFRVLHVGQQVFLRKERSG